MIKLDVDELTVDLKRRVGEILETNRAAIAAAEKESEQAKDDLSKAMHASEKAEQKLNKCTNVQETQKLGAAQSIVDKIQRTKFDIDSYNADKIESLMKSIRENDGLSVKSVIQLYSDIAQLKAYFAKFNILERIKHVAELMGLQDLEIERGTGYKIFNSFNKLVGVGNLAWSNDEDQEPTSVRKEVNDSSFSPCLNSVIDRSLCARLYANVNGERQLIAETSTAPCYVNLDEELTHDEREHHEDHISSVTNRLGITHQIYIPTFDYQIQIPDMWEIYQGVRHISIFNLKFIEKNNNSRIIYMFNELRVLATRLLPEMLINPDRRILNQYRSLGEVGLFTKNRNICMSNEQIAVMLLGSNLGIFPFKHLFKIPYMIEADKKRYADAESNHSTTFDDINIRIGRTIEFDLKNVIDSKYNPHFYYDTLTIKYADDTIDISDETLSSLENTLKTRVPAKYRKGVYKTYSVDISPLKTSSVDFESLSGIVVCGCFVVDSVTKEYRTTIKVSGSMINAIKVNYDTSHLYPTITDGKLTGFYFLED